MRGHSRGWRFAFAALALALMAGCGVNSTFVYKPAAPVAGGPKLPIKIAVLPFKDGTEDFTQRGSIFSSGHYNLAKGGVSGSVTALTPELWAKGFADDMAASGSFQAVRFVYSPSELAGEDFYIEGTLKKAYVGMHWEDGNEFVLYLKALGRPDNNLYWEKEVTREWKTSASIMQGCGMGIQCSVDRLHADTNRVMQGIFAEARADLLATLASRSGNRAGEARNEEFFGIGLRVGIAAGDVLTVESVIEGAPGSKAGMQAGDSILSIDGKPTAGMAIADAVGRMRGVKGTSVTLGVKRTGWNTPRDFTLARDVIRAGTSSPQAPESVEQTIERIYKAK